MRRGIVLAGGTGTRLYPITLATSKQLLPVYDKPMVYYALSVLMLMGIREIAVITTPGDQPLFRKLLGDGEALGLSLTYVTQERPDGLAQAYLLTEEFLAGGPSAMVLGDNLFFGHGLPEVLQRAEQRRSGGTVFGYRVADPERYGVVTFDEAGRVTAVEEKPKVPQSSYAVTGLYLFDERAPRFAREATPSARGELEITAVIDRYLQEGSLQVELLGRGYAWLDTGTHDSLLQAGEFIRTVEQRQGMKIGCLEEIAYRMGFIDRPALLRLAKRFAATEYGRYLRGVADEEP